MVPVVKKNGQLRLCVDYRYLNESIEREFFQIPTLEDVIGQLSGAKVFSKLDARSGYHQIPISKASQKYLVFSTPFDITDLRASRSRLRRFRKFSKKA